MVIPFNVSCGHCWMCDRGLQSQCETTQVHEQGMGATLLGFTKLYGNVPGGQAEFLRVPQAQYGPVKVPEEAEGMPDERFVYLSDVLPTSWQAVEYAGVPEGGSVAVFGLGPIGQMSARIARHKGFRVIAVDLVPERLEMARRYGIEVVDIRDHDGDLPDAIREMTDGRGPDSVIEAVGMEAHGSPATGLAQTVTGLLPDSVAQEAMNRGGVDRLSALYSAIDTVRRGGTISLIGLYGGMADPLPMLTLFDKQIQLRMGQANVKHWTDDIMPLLTRRLRPFGRRGPRHPQVAAGGGPPRLRDLPEEAGRRGQGLAEALSSCAYPPECVEGRFSRNLGPMEALCEAIPGSAQRKRHKRCCQGTATVHEQVTNSVGHGVLADEEPLEDLPVGADGYPQGENRGPQRDGPTLGHGPS